MCVKEDANAVSRENSRSIRAAIISCVKLVQAIVEWDRNMVWYTVHPECWPFNGKLSRPDTFAYSQPLWRRLMSSTTSFQCRHTSLKHWFVFIWPFVGLLTTSGTWDKSPCHVHTPFVVIISGIAYVLAAVIHRSGNTCLPNLWSALALNMYYTVFLVILSCQIIHSGNATQVKTES